MPFIQAWFLQKVLALLPLLICVYIVVHYIQSADNDFGSTYLR